MSATGRVPRSIQRVRMPRAKADGLHEVATIPADLGHCPTKAQFTERASITAEAFYRYYDSWTAVLDAAAEHTDEPALVNPASIPGPAARTDSPVRNSSRTSGRAESRSARPRVSPSTRISVRIPSPATRTTSEGGGQLSKPPPVTPLRTIEIATRDRPASCLQNCPRDYAAAADEIQSVSTRTWYATGADFGSSRWRGYGSARRTPCQGKADVDHEDVTSRFLRSRYDLAR